MFNLVIICTGYCDYCSPILDAETLVRVGGPGGRLFDYTAQELKGRYAPDVGKLKPLPTLISAEGYDSPAVLGRIVSLELGDKIVSDYKEIISFEFERVLGGLSVGEILESKYLKGMGDYSYLLSRCHWSVHDYNIVEAVFETVGRVCEKRLEVSRPKIFRVREWPMPVLGHVAVMMPFQEKLNPTYDAIKSACESQSMKAIRVDDLSRPNVIMDDIFEIIVQSSLVICDFTDKNPNVTYEAGVAHALNKDVIMLTQNPDDIGFDLRHRRYIHYSPDPQGLKAMEVRLSRFISETLGREYPNSAGGFQW